MTHAMHLNDQPFALIKSGEKTVELRLNDEKRRAIQVGDHIVFNDSLEVEVVALHAYPDFERLYAAFPLSALGYLPDEEYDIYYGSASVHSAGNEGAADNQAADVVRKLLEIH